MLLYSMLCTDLQEKSMLVQVQKRFYNQLRAKQKHVSGKKKKKVDDVKLTVHLTSRMISSLLM